MIHALRYELRGQRQRYAPREHQEGETEQRHIHLHLHMHIHLNLGARRTQTRRLLQPTTTRVTAIFAAFMGALSMALSFTVMSVTTFPFVGPHIALAGQIMFIGALIGSSAVFFGGLPLVIQTWRSRPRSRLLLSVPLLIFLGLCAFVPSSSLFGIVNIPLLLAELLLLAALWRPTWRKRSLFVFLSLFILTMPLALLFPFLNPGISVNTVNIVLTFLLYGIPLVSTVAIVRAIRQAKLSDRVLRFTTLPSLLVAGGVLLMIAGMLVWAGTVLVFLPSLFPQILNVLTLPPGSWLLQFIGMLIALVVTLFALFRRPRSHNKTKPQPHDDALFDVTSHRERGEYPVDGKQRFQKEQGL